MDALSPQFAAPDFAAAGGYPIGVVATLTGLPVDVIRAWERRYGVPRPTRTAGGHRLYSPRDVALLRRAVALRDQGHTAAAACAQALAEVASRLPALAVESPTLPTTTNLSRRLRAAALALEAGQVSAVLAEASALLDVETLWARVVAPALRCLGEDWERGAASPAPEHLLSSLVRGRLAALLESWLRHPTAPAIVVAAGPEERHDLAPLMLSLLLARAGWAVTFLGADTPTAALEEVVRTVRPRAAVVAATMADHACPALDSLRWVRERLGPQAPVLAYGGPAFAGTPAATAGSPFMYLEDDVKSAEAQITAQL